MTDNVLDTLRHNHVDDLLPRELEDQLRQLGVTDTHVTQPSPEVTVIRATVAGASDRGLPQLATLPIEAPGLSSGLRMQLAVHQAVGGAVDQWALDLDLDRIAVAIPGLRPAREVSEPARATRLVDATNRTDVRLVGRGVLRIASSGGATPAVTLIDELDATNPFGPRGVLATLTFEPSSFFLGGSSFGMTVQDLVFDQSPNVSPDPTHHPPSWRGLALRRATLFLPPGAPLLGDLSLGVQNVFLGDPVGVEGTAFVEFGGAADTPLALIVEQETSPGTWTALTLTTLSGANERQDRVAATLQGPYPPDAHVRARLTTTPATGTVVWLLPRDQLHVDGFDVQPGDTLAVRVDAPSGSPSTAPTTCVFTGSVAAAPTVDLTLGSARWTNVTSVSGVATSLTTAVFGHSAAVGAFAWQWDGGAEQSTATTAVPPTVGAHVLELRTAGYAVRRIRVDVRAHGPILVGCRAGVFTTDATGASVHVDAVDVSGTYALAGWHGRSVLDAAEPAATATGGTVTVAQGLLAEVTTAATSGTGGAPPPPPSTASTETTAHVQFVYDSEELDPLDGVWIGAARRSGTALEDWVRGLGATARFAVVGRCDDLNTRIPDRDTSDTYNQALAVRRANATCERLVRAQVDPSRIAVRGEQSGWITAPPAPSTGTLPTEATDTRWQARFTPDYLSWDTGAHRVDDPHRPPLRRGDIYAYDITPTADAPPPAQDGNTLDPARLRALVPGADITTVGGPVHSTPPRGRPQFRVRIEVEWNDPTARGLGEAIPIRAEVWIQWPGAPIPVPGGGGSATLTRPSDSTGSTPVWTLRGRWAHDRTAGSDDFTLSLDVAGSPTGLAQIDNKVLAAAAGLAPAVIGAAHNPTGGDAALVSALIAAIGAAASALLSNGKIVVTGVTIDHLHRGPSGPGSLTKVTIDYTVELGVSVTGGGLPINVATQAGHPLRLRYRGVGVVIDTGVANWYNGVGLTIGNAVPEVVDPGSWQLGPPLGDLLRVTGARSGAQSSWLEVDLALSLDLGVVKLSNATVRITFGSSGVEGIELRGLRASVDIPATLRGEGSLSVSEGSISAGIQLEVIPLKIAAVANLSLGRGGFVELTVGVRFPAPIPFANSGLGLFGVVGRFVSNGERAVVSDPDPVKRELGWLAKDPPKYTGHPGQYALGLGASVGTVADLGFTFHALGMVTVEFPRPAVIFAIIAEFIASPAPPPLDTFHRPDHGLSIIGMVVIDSDAVTIALRGHYEIPHILVLDVPVGAYFPYAQPTSSWVHIGTDNQPGRLGDPVTITFLPGTLDVRAWAFIMVHGDGFSPGLQGNADFVFSGFAIGFGAGWEINWSAGPIKLHASATVLAGFGTDPMYLAAGIFVEGELDLVILSISARGEITVKTDGNQTDLHGRFCGEVDCFFFSISGCVEIDVSATLGAPEAPKSPTKGVDLVARLGHATAEAATSGTPPTVWPDTVPVVHFSHTVENGIAGGGFGVGTPMPGPVWSGSNDLKNAFRIAGVRLEPTSGPAFSPTPPATQFDTAWWWPGIRSTAKPPWLSASESEPRDLALLSWEPWTGLMPLTEPDGSPGDPGPLVGAVCDPVSYRKVVCVVGALGRPAGHGAAVVPQDPAEATPGVEAVRLRTSQPGDRPWEVAVAVAVSAGVAVVPGGLTPLDTPTALASGPARQQGWRLASFVRAGQELGALGLAASYDPQLEQPTLVLEVCTVPVRDRPEDPRQPGPTTGERLDFADLNPDELRMLTGGGPVLGRQGFTVTDLAGEPLRAVDADGDGRWELVVSDHGVRVELPAPTGQVRVQVAGKGDWTALARDANGQEVDKAESPGSTTVMLGGEGIVAVEVYVAGQGGLAEVCVGDDPAGSSSAVLEWQPKDGRADPPEVIGVRSDGQEEQWKPEAKQGRLCATVVYHAPDAGPWAGFRIPAAPGRRVTIVGSCGVRWQDGRQSAHAEAHRQDVLTAITRHATGAAGAVRATASVAGGVAGAGVLLPVAIAGPPPRVLLAPGTEYRLSVDWQWQRWERSASSTQPGTPDAAAWQSGGTDVYRFCTASLAATATPPPPVDLVGEGTFDPRSVARYVTGARPAGLLPHLLRDPIRVTFSVDYLAKLLDGYGFDVKVEVRPTDVHPGSLTAATLHPPDVVTAATIRAWTDDAVLRAVEARVVEAATSAPCLPPTSLGGTAVEVLADLQPDKAYDLVLAADPRAAGTNVVIARWHFRTSRWHDVHEVLEVLGLTAGTANPVAPEDVLLDGQWPGLTVILHDDADFDAALTELHLDPWPLSPIPRTKTLWVPPDPSMGRTTWAFAGALLEAPEPIARDGRITVDGFVGAVPLAAVRSSANGARVLLAPLAVVSPGPDDALSVRLVDTLCGITATGAAQLLGGPRTIRRETS